jgi:hypothetical protein
MNISKLLSSVPNMYSDIHCIIERQYYELVKEKIMCDLWKKFHFLDKIKADKINAVFVYWEGNEKKFIVCSHPLCTEQPPRGMFLYAGEVVSHTVTESVSIQRGERIAFKVTKRCYKQTKHYYFRDKFKYWLFSSYKVIINGVRGNLLYFR